MNLKDNIDMQRLPSHIAIIMDGNGRWAKEKGEDRLYGHLHGVESVRNIVEGAAELGVKYLTLYAFSTENWDRPEYEVSGLMELLVDTIHNEVPTLNKNNIKLHVIGDTNMLPEAAKKELDRAQPGNGFKLQQPLGNFKGREADRCQSKGRQHAGGGCQCRNF
jgi:undecaprenyl diphosphate synthase